MKSSITKLLFLALVANATAQVACIQAITTTMSYLPALTLAADNSCPTASNASYYSVEGDTGCCSAAATPVKLESTAGLACCPCGALCTGYLPRVQAWTLSGNNLQLTGTASLTTMATLAPSTTTNISVTSNQLNGGSSTTFPSSVSSTTLTSTSASPTSSSGAGRGQGKVRDMFSALSIFMGALWIV